jgi:DNA mismatch endonuclease (patch repair protein)
LHANALPGKPDIVFPKYNAVIFVQGCFWHGHDCHLFKWPKSRPEFWKAKIEGNVIRDSVNCQELQRQGWRILRVWECALKGKYRLDPDAMINFVCAWIKGNEETGELAGGDW